MGRNKESVPFWGVTKKGVVWSEAGFVVSSCLALLVYGNLDWIPFYWERRLLIELSLLITPPALALMILIFSGFFTKEIEWRVSERGFGWFFFIWITGTLIALLGSILSEKMQITTILLAFGVPFILGLIPFFSWGFRAAKSDKDIRTRYRGR